MMSVRTLFEVLLITAYALLLNAAALVAGLLLFVGAEGFACHSGFGIFLLVLSSVAVFGTALLALRRGPIDTPLRGARLGLTAAGLFYALIVILFGLLPALAYLPTGNLDTVAGYLGDVVHIAVAGSYGLPVITGGAFYGWLRRSAAN
jgi:hypothetical protein